MFWTLNTNVANSVDINLTHIHCFTVQSLLWDNSSAICAYEDVLTNDGYSMSDIQNYFLKKCNLKQMFTIESMPSSSIL